MDNCFNISGKLGEGELMTTYEAAWLFFAGVFVIMFYYYSLENAQNTYYWRGRKDGWDMHRRMIDNKRKTDEVFDYEKQN